MTLQEVWVRLSRVEALMRVWPKGLSSHYLTAEFIPPLH